MSINMTAVGAESLVRRHRRMSRYQPSPSVRATANTRVLLAGPQQMSG